jgi:glycosyltransferase involved in cell wall biosynthesis
MKAPNITVILNVYKRSKNFEAQMNALMSQSIKPKEILVWENGEEFVPNKFRENLTVTRSSTNFGVWARFAYALNATGEYICMFDDDTIPGSKWLENCYKTMLKTPGLLGTRGLVFDSPLVYSMYREIGVYGQNETTEKVDIVGHSWFFKREWLSVYWFDFENRFQSQLAGEDIHFSYVLQKYLKLPTLVPPHPKNKPDMWGSEPDLARKLGSDKQSISQSSESLKRFENALQHYRKLGFSVLSENKHNKPKFPKIVYFLVQKQPRIMHFLAKKIKNFKI